jgi:hypothetical protein
MPDSLITERQAARRALDILAAVKHNHETMSRDDFSEWLRREIAAARQELAEG